MSETPATVPIEQRRRGRRRAMSGDLGCEVYPIGHQCAECLTMARVRAVADPIRAERDALAVVNAELRAALIGVGGTGFFGVYPCWCDMGIGHTPVCQRARELVGADPATRGAALLAAFAQAIEAVEHLLEDVPSDADPGPGIRRDLAVWRALNAGGGAS